MSEYPSAGSTRENRSGSTSTPNFGSSRATSTSLPWASLTCHLTSRSGASSKVRVTDPASGVSVWRTVIRIEAGPRDSVTIRAVLDGYRQEEIHVKVRSREKTVMLELSPLPNTLSAMTHSYFSGRGSLTFLTKEALTFRVQKCEQSSCVLRRKFRYRISHLHHTRLGL